MARTHASASADLRAPRVREPGRWSPRRTIAFAFGTSAVLWAGIAWVVGALLHGG